MHWLRIVLTACEHENVNRKTWLLLNEFFYEAIRAAIHRQISTKPSRFLCVLVGFVVLKSYVTKSYIRHDKNFFQSIDKKPLEK